MLKFATSPPGRPVAPSFEATVFVVDDDPEVRRSMFLLARSVDLKVQTFVSAKEFLDHFDDSLPGCLVFDVWMPGMSGLELQAELAKRNVSTPIIFITAKGEIALASQALRAGAVDFIQKPFSPHAMLERIHEALDRDQEQRRSQSRWQQVDARIAQLTDREREVMYLLADGKGTKTVAVHLGISSKTVDNHRAKVLEKMHVDNTAELTGMIIGINRHS